MKSYMMIGDELYSTRLWQNTTLLFNTKNKKNKPHIY